MIQLCGDLMSENKIEMKMLESKLLTNNIIKFELEDKTIVMVKVEIARVGVATTYKNPDGSPHYNIEVANTMQIIPKDKKFFITKPSPMMSKEKKEVGIV